jgi:hypothetical protein
MKRVLPLAAIAGALAAVVAVGSAQAAPASGNILGKLTTVGENGAAVEKAGYRHRGWHHHRHWWKKRYYRRHHDHGYRHHYRRHRHWH